MSDADQPAEEAVTQAPQPESTEKSQRNPLERILVWGLIVVGVVVIGAEARARLAFSRSWANIEGEIAKAEEQDLSDFRIDAVPALIEGSPSHTEETNGLKRIDHYEWKGLVKTYGFRVTSGIRTNIVTGIVEATAPLVEELKPAPDSDAGDDSDPGMGMSGDAGGEIAGTDSPPPNQRPPADDAGESAPSDETATPAATESAEEDEEAAEPPADES